MHTITARLSALGAGIALTVLGAAGCNSNSTPGGTAASGKASVKAVASALKHSPQYKADKAALKKRLNSCWHQNAASFHPVKGTIHCAFPKGSTAAIEAYAKQTFTLGVVSSASVRHLWEQGVVVYALNHGQK